MKLITTILFLVVLCTTMRAADGDPQHGLLTSVLTSHVSGGRIDYKGVKRDRRFAMYLTALSTSRPDTMSAQQQKAFWINAYNAFAMKLVCDNYPLTSIRELDNGQILDRPMFQVGSVMYSLRSIVIEHLAPLRDHRIYTALCFAARGCPPLSTRAYEASTLDALLSEQATRFVRDTSLNTVNVAEHRMVLSRIFEWNLPAIGTTYEQLVAAVLPWYDATITTGDGSARWTVEFSDFDWSLNGK